MVGCSQRGGAGKQTPPSFQTPVVWRVANVSVNCAMLPSWSKLLEQSISSQVVHFVDILEKVSLEGGIWRRQVVIAHFKVMFSLAATCDLGGETDVT